jgi:hypothetical protein
MAKSIIAVVTLAVMVLLIAAPREAEAITCEQVTSAIAPCIPFARHGGILPPACCQKIKLLYAAAKTTSDRQIVCNCLKTAAHGASDVKPVFISGLLGKCGVHIGYPISTSFDCSK